MSFTALPLPELKDPPWASVIPSRLRHLHQQSQIANFNDEEKSIFSVNRQAWELQPDGSYIQRYPNKNEPERSEFLCNLVIP